MKLPQLLLLAAIISSYHCTNSWQFDPSVPYPVLQDGDYWVDKFHEGGLQNSLIHEDKLFCNTINISSGPNYLYCLSLSTGKVLWKYPVKKFAADPVIIHKDKLVYVSYVGDFFVLNLSGQLLFEQKLSYSYAGIALNPINSNLLIQSVTDGVFEYNFENGALIHQYGEGNIGMTLPVFNGQKMIFGNFGAIAGDKNDRLTCIDYVSKKILWQTSCENTVDLLKINQKILALRLYGGFSLSCFDLETGAFLWDKPHTNASHKLAFIEDENHHKIPYYTVGFTPHFIDENTGNELQTKVNPTTQSFTYKIGEETFTCLIQQVFDPHNLYKITIEQQ
jgi:hypothetical protein